MIPLATQRAAHRQATINRIAAWPAAARFRGIPDLQVFASAPRKMRDVRAAGAWALTDLEAEIALPLDQKRPEPEQEIIEIVDQSGDYVAYTVSIVEALRGERCFKLGLRARASKPVLQAPQVPRY
jgi:hypothetical protein